MKRMTRQVQKPYKSPKQIPEKTKKLVRNRDEVCVRCGYPYQLEFHHIITKGRYYDPIYNLKGVHDPRNIVLLCQRCHRLVHDDPKVMKQMLLFQRNKFGNVKKHSKD